MPPPVHGAVREIRPPPLPRRGCSTQRPVLPRRCPEPRRTVPGTAGGGTGPVLPAMCVPPKWPLPPRPRPAPAVPGSPVRQPGAAESAHLLPEALPPPKTAPAPQLLPVPESSTGAGNNKPEPSKRWHRQGLQIPRIPGPGPAQTCLPPWGSAPDGARRADRSRRRAGPSGTKTRTAYRRCPAFP